MPTEVIPAIAVACDLCGLTCGSRPYQQKFGQQDRLFCCMGCMNVYLILSESAGPGQNFRDTELFRRSLELGIISNPEQTAETSEVKAEVSGPIEELLLHVCGMWCSSCAWLIEYAVRKVKGVVAVEASFASDLVKIKYQPQFTPPGKIHERIQSLGYKAEEFRPGQEIEDKEKRDLILRLGIAGFLWMNVMYLSFTLYTSFFEHIADSIRQYVPFVIWALATPVIFYCGYPILRLAWLGLKNRTIRAEALLSLGILAAYFYSIAQAFRADPHIYFDTACVIVTLVLAGKLIERNAKQRASRWITLLHRMMPNKVRLLSDVQERFASVDALQPGQEFVVKAGEQVPADGIVADGDSYCDESLLTGESHPLNKKPGSEVVAGSVNLDGVLRVRALRAAQDSTLAQIVGRVEHALGQRSPIERAVDRVSRVFVPAVIVVALITFAVAVVGFHMHLGAALMRAITVLVIACPCALGLATPLAVTAAMGSASRRGILFRDSSVLETVRKVDAVVVDKTGTATEGSFNVRDCVLFESQSSRVVVASNADPRTGRLASQSALRRDGHLIEAISRLASLEQYSEHPLGRAIVDFARAQEARFSEASGVEIKKGAGILGYVHGESVVAGNRRLMQDQHICIGSQAEKQARQWESEGKTVTLFARAGELCGLMACGDRVRDGAGALVAELKNNGLSVHLISGDALATTRSVATAIGIDHYQSDVLPEQKADFVRELQSRGMKVAVVGDGINDASALAQADLGIAMGSGTDIAMKAAAVVLMKSSLDEIPEIFALSAKTIQVVRQNLFWAFFYNGLGILLAVTGVLNPILAAGAMLLSSVSVVSNSLRLTRR